MWLRFRSEEAQLRAPLLMRLALRLAGLVTVVGLFALAVWILYLALPAIQAIVLALMPFLVLVVAYRLIMRKLH